MLISKNGDSSNAITIPLHEEFDQMSSSEQKENIRESLESSLLNGNQDLVDLIQNERLSKKKKTYSKQERIGIANEIMYSLKTLFEGKVDFEITEFNEKHLKGKAGYLKEGKIYLNSSVFGPETVIHEVMHLIMGNLKAINPDAYIEVLNMFEGNGEYVANMISYVTEFGYSLEDAKEEAFADMIGLYASTNINVSETFNVNGIISLILDSLGLPNIDSNSEVKLKALLSTSLAEALSFGEDSQEIRTSHQTNRKINNLKKNLISDGTLKIKCD